MDNRRFDAIVKTLTESVTRRGALRGLAGSALAAGLTWRSREEAAACRKIGKKCKRDSQCCGRRCQGGKCRCVKAGNGCTTTADCCSGLECQFFGCRFTS